MGTGQDQTLGSEPRSGGASGFAPLPRQKYGSQSQVPLLWPVGVRAVRRKFVICEKTKYGCSTWRTREESVCPNAIKVSRKLVESLLLESIQRDLFTEEGLTVFKQEVARLLAEQRRTRRPELTQATARLQGGRD